MEIPTIASESDLKTTLQNSDVILDAIFGFSFVPPIRAPFDTALKLISESKLPIVSVDIPSGNYYMKLCVHDLIVWFVNQDGMSKKAIKTDLDCSRMFSSA